MSKKEISLQKNSDDEDIIEQWIKRNNSGKIIIGPKNAGVTNKVKMQNGKKALPIISVTKKNNKNGDSQKSSLSSNKKINTKRSTAPSCLAKTKIARWSSPAVSIQIEPASVVTSMNSEKKDSCSKPEPSTQDKKKVVLLVPTSTMQGSNPVQISKTLQDPKLEEKITNTVQRIPSFARQVSNSVQQIPSFAQQVPNSVQVAKCLKKKLLAQNKLKKLIVPTKKAFRHGKCFNNSNTAKLQMTDDQDVYSSVKYNYKHILPPKNWSVTKFENDSLEQCIIFSKPRVIIENEKLITVIERSLIIDKSGTLHYSVNGLSVNVRGTILPDVLDNIKKLLSILHIFDKMQVCKGVGDDSLIVKTDGLLQDICQIWRHIDCKLVVVKTDQCQLCLDARNVLLEKEMLFKSEVLEMHCLETQIKEEEI